MRTFTPCLRPAVAICILAGFAGTQVPVRALTNFTLLTSFTGNVFGQLSVRIPICALLL